MSNTIVYEDGTAFHPGSYLEDLLDDWQMTPAQFAHKLGKPLETVDQLLAGEIPVDLELASKLEEATDISAAAWLNLQFMFDEKVEAHKKG